MNKSFVNVVYLLDFIQREIKSATTGSKLAVQKDVRYIVVVTRSLASSMNELVTTFKTGNTWLIRNHVESYTANLGLLHKYFCRHFTRGRCLLSAFVYACVYIFIYAYIYTHTCTHKHVYTYTYKYTVMRTEVVASITIHEHISINEAYEHVYINRQLYTFKCSMNRYALEETTI